MASPSVRAVAAAMDPSWEDEDEEEEEDIEEAEQFVLVELSGIIDSDFLSKCENKCKILGIDTERPILQVDSYVFAGEYEDTLGTCVIFEEGVERDGVEWLQMKDNDFSYRPNMICSFLHENEDEAVVPAPDKPVELEDEEIQMESNAEQTQEQETGQHSEAEDPGSPGDTPAETESSVFMGIQDGNVSQS
ncbi:general transcription factor 3C polypeptide 6 isoform X2 [Microtus oregoni]|uniref:general transcription factor 3C polypeptide 6 isoform X2 n=1 Tax=Microtus oregoni TaxID=111838 RepID=UPI001BB12054|nr:general transcription factor 3C polypeptide 6 isoform X2 [Microtus oregoni]